MRQLVVCLTLGYVLAVGSLQAQEKAPAPAAKATTADSIEPKFLSNVRRLTHDFVKAGEGYFSPDGETIIYQAVPKDYPFYQIYTQSLDDGATSKLVSTGRGRTTCSFFSPDGKKILFASSHLDPKLSETEAEARRQAEEDRKSKKVRRYSWDFDPHMDIFEADLDGKNLRQLTKEFGYDAEGAWSRDGKLIAFASTRGAKKGGTESSAVDLYVMNADGTSVRRLTDSPGYDGGPFISPDGKWVVYRTDRKKPEMLQIHVIGIDGQNDTALTDNNGVNWGPYWHPTRPYIIWSGADHSDPNARPNYDLWLMKYEVADGRFRKLKEWRITDHAGGDVLPVFSPDGRKLMWTSTRATPREGQLFIADFKLPEE
jgi:Tol biopolymer transport system component